MPVYKDPERGTWFVELRYKDYSGKQRKHKKRGFRTQREAKEHEREFLSSIHPGKRKYQKPRINSGV